jgi:2'-hydroxyisoflavone reductase
MISVNRREAMMMASAAAATLLAGQSFGAQTKSEDKVKPLKVLILGGTGLIGPHLVRELSARGHQLTLLNRGKRNPGMFPNIETLLGDRNGPLDVLQGREWDVVVDNSGYLPAQVKQSTQVLKDRVRHYIYVSSISAYVDLTPPGIDEDYPLAQLKDPNVTEITNDTYGGLKAACERLVEETFGTTRQAVIRPSYIVGPGDSSDRFTYWPVRTARGGEMLAPGTALDPVQFVDVRDLAEFMRGCVERSVAGRYNACNPPGAVTMGDLLDTSKRVSKSNASFAWASQSFLEQNKALESGEIPIWSPTTGKEAGATLVSSARAVAQGLRFRDLETTVRDTLAWHEQRPADQKSKLRAGLTAEREATLLKQLKALA